MSACAPGPIVFAYDGSELAEQAIAEAGELLSHDRPVLVVVAWQPFDVGFIPDDSFQIDAKQVPEVKRAAQDTAAHGAELAKRAGFTDVRSMAIETAPIWQGIVKVAEDEDASVIVIGSHGHHSGLAGVFVGSVASAVSAHSTRTVLITQRRD
jgi:nucleotide-binding universal stress UspA family protein